MLSAERPPLATPRPVSTALRVCLVCRAQFHAMCATAGVDPLASNKGTWNKLLGLGGGRPGWRGNLCACFPLRLPEMLPLPCGVLPPSPPPLHTCTQTTPPCPPKPHLPDPPQTFTMSWGCRWWRGASHRAPSQAASSSCRGCMSMCGCAGARQLAQPRQPSQEQPASQAKERSPLL